MPQFSPQNQTSEVTAAEWERRKAFVRFTEDDVKALAPLHPVAEQYADEVVDELYRHFFAFGETKAFFPDEATINHVKSLQKEYFLGLTRGDYGVDFLANRLVIGRIHQRIGLSPQWYVGAYSVYIQLVFPHVMSAFGGQSKQTHPAFLALNKLMMLDMELAITTYISAGEAVIKQQSQEIMEISTPVVQVWEGIVATPLIGTLDSQRTQQFVERLLNHIVETKSQVALVDITGVPTVDTQTAQHLMEAIKAVNLLGAQVVLTGVRPAIAQTLVHLGVDLEGVTTRSSLSAGLRVALKALDLQVVHTTTTNQE